MALFKKGADHPDWKGEKAEYSSKHQYLTKKYPELKKSCVKCGATNCRIEWANISGEYHREVEDYMALCVPCHRRMDLFKSHCPQGHEYSGYNLKLTKEGYRQCRTCSVERTRLYRIKKKEKLWQLKTL